MDAVVPAQDLVGRRLDVRVEVHRVDDLDVAVSLRELAERPERVGEGPPEVLAAVRRHDDQAPAGSGERERGRRGRLQHR